MKKTAHVQRRFDTEHRILDKIGKLLPVGERRPWSYPAVAEEIGEAAHAVLLAKKTMEDAGVLRTTLEYPKGQSGRVSMWELTMPLPLAHDELTREHERQLNRPSMKAQRRSRATAGVQPGELRSMPTPRIEDARALVKEAREYVARIEWARNHIAEMRGQGIEIDMASVTVHRDEQLETIAKILPAVDELERENERLNDQVQRWLGHEGGASGHQVADAAF